MKRANLEKAFGLKDRIGYAFGDFGCNMNISFVNDYVMIFYVNCMKIDPAHFAIILLIAKIFDAINDPIIGGLCDAYTPNRSSKFKPWIKWLSIPLMATSLLMFVFAQNAPYTLKTAMCLGLYCLWSIFYTGVNVPYGSMQSVITTNSDERASLSSWRSIGAMVAMVPVMMIPFLIYDDNDNPVGERFIFAAAFICIVDFISYLQTLVQIE